MPADAKPASRPSSTPSMYGTSVRARRRCSRYSPPSTTPWRRPAAPEAITMALYRTGFEIDASDEQVWAVLTDFDSYPDWNPSLPSISGELREGSTVSLTLGMPGRPNMKVKARIGEVTPNRRFTWQGNVG